MQARFRERRGAAYTSRLDEFGRLSLDPTFADFIDAFAADGASRKLHSVEISSPDPAAVVLAANWLRRLSRQKVTYRLQFDAGLDLVEAVRFWAGVLGVPAAAIKLQRVPGSDPSWRSAHGVVAVETRDRHLRSRLESWIDRSRGECPSGLAPRLGNVRRAV